MNAPLLVWLGIAAVAVLALVPLGWAMLAGGRLRGRRDAALSLHRAQLDELDRDLAEHRLLPTEHAAARLEVQRRLLAEAEQEEKGASNSSAFPIVLTAALVPALALIIYAADGGTPDYRARAQQAAEQTQAATSTAADEAMMARLRNTLATMDPHADSTRRGYLLLGSAELKLGHLPETADAFRHALAARFDPALGAETAEVITEAESHVTPEAKALFQRALAEAPANVPWRKDAEKRVLEAGGS